MSCQSNKMSNQGCQIFLGKYVLPKQFKIMYQMNTKCSKWSYNIPNACKIFQMALKYINIFQSRALQNLPKLGFWVWKETIWQPWQTYILFYKLSNIYIFCRMYKLPTVLCANFQTYWAVLFCAPRFLMGSLRLG
jgi:hypothetical protein